MIIDVDKYVEREIKWLFKQEREVAELLLQHYAEALDEITSKIKKYDKEQFTRKRLKFIEAQLESILMTMQSQMGSALGKGMKRTYNKNIPRHLTAWALFEEAFGDQDMAEKMSMIPSIVPQKTLRNLLLTKDIPIKNFSDDLQREVRGVLGRSVILGEGVLKAAKRIEHLAQVNKWRLNLIARMEIARSQNESNEEAIKQVAKNFPELDLWYMIRDSVDRSSDTRNHSFSWAINGLKRNAKKEKTFKIDVSIVQREFLEWKKITGRKMKKISGVVWKKQGQYYVGKNVPAHFNDRAVIMPYRPEWERHFSIKK